MVNAMEIVGYSTCIFTQTLLKLCLGWKKIPLFFNHQ